MQPQCSPPPSGRLVVPVSGDDEPSAQRPFSRISESHSTRSFTPQQPQPTSPGADSAQSPSERRAPSPERLNSSVISQRLDNSPRCLEGACTCDAALELEELRCFTERVKALNSVLLTNISSLYKTAREEIKRKDQMLAEKDKQLSDRTAEVEALKRRLSENGGRPAHRSQGHRRGDP